MSRFYNPLTPGSGSHGTSSFKYPYVINRKGNRNTQTYQVEVVSLDLTPNSCNLFTEKCKRNKEGRIYNQIMGVKGSRLTLILEKFVI